MNKQQRIVSLVRKEYERATEAYRNRSAERAAAYAGHYFWEKNNLEDGVGGMSENPYNLNLADKLEMDTRNHLANMKQAYNHAVDTFLKDEDQ